jgi:hypothetical protein
MAMKIDIAALLIPLLLFTGCTTHRRTDAMDPLTPMNADLIAVTPSCIVWATRTPNIYAGESSIIPHSWEYWETTYHVVGQDFTYRYSTVEPFYDASSICVSPGGSLLKGNEMLLLSNRDAASSTDSNWLKRLNFETDNRDDSEWIFEIESPGKVEAGVEPTPSKYLRVKTDIKTGCRIPLYDYDATNVSTILRHEGWKRKWPVLKLGLFKNNMIIWNGLEWQEVRLQPLTRIVACVVIDYLEQDTEGHRSWLRITYTLEDDGSLNVSKTGMYRRNIISSYHGRPHKPKSLNEPQIDKVEMILEALPPSTGKTLTQGIIRIAGAGPLQMDRSGNFPVTVIPEEEFIRSYPVTAVPEVVLQLLDLMGGLQYELDEVLMPIELDNPL